MSAPPCPFGLCDGTGITSLYLGGVSVRVSTCPCAPREQPAAPLPPDPWGIAPPGCHPDEAPLQLDPDPLDESRSMQTIQKSRTNTPEIEALVLQAAEAKYGADYSYGGGEPGEVGEFHARAYFSESGRWCVSVLTGDDRHDGEICCEVVDEEPGLAGTGLGVVQIS